MEHERSTGDKCLIAAVARALDVARLVYLGVQMLLEVVLILEIPVALGAERVHIVVMRLEFRKAVEYLYSIT